MSRIPGLILIALAAALGGQPTYAQSDEKLAKKVEKLDAQLVKALSILATKYDDLKDPEAAHFFASCALGYGPKDDKLIGIKNAWEIAVFIGKIRGGQVLKDIEPVVTALSGLNQEYKGIRDSLWTPGTHGTLSNAAVKILRDAGVKMELTQSAHDYIRVTQRFNTLRQAMGLRAIFWDFEKSTPLILAAWYMGQTGDYEDDPSPFPGPTNKSHVLYTTAVEDGRKHTSRIPNNELTHYPDQLRPFALIRQDLLNPNARTFSFAHWAKAWAINHMVLYTIPELPYRDDIPTPTARFKDETLVKPWSGWVDTEETILVNGKKVPYVRYPYDGEPDAPWRFYSGEDGWAKDEYKHLRDTGVPIMLRFFAKVTPSDVKTRLTDENHKVLDCRLYLNDDKRLLSCDNWATVLLVPESQLAQGKKFTVSIDCRIDGTPFEKAWSFTTRKE